MLVGRLPFSTKCTETNDQDNKILFEKILNDEVRFPLDLSNESKSILSQFLEKKPLKRLGSSVHDLMEIKNHSFFNTIEWQMLMDRRIEPPFRPLVNSDSDTCYFEKEFTGENVQLTPSESDSSLVSNNYFDSFSFYGSKSSLNSHKSDSSRSSNHCSLEDVKSDQFDTKSLTQSSTSLNNKTTNDYSSFQQSKLSYLSSSRKKLIEDDSSCDAWKLLASRAFPNICAFPNLIPNIIFSESQHTGLHSFSPSSISDLNMDEKMDIK